MCVAGGRGGGDCTENVLWLVQSVGAVSVTYSKNEEQLHKDSSERKNARNQRAGDGVGTN